MHLFFTNTYFTKIISVFITIIFTLNFIMLILLQFSIDIDDLITKIYYKRNQGGK